MPATAAMRSLLPPLLLAAVLLCLAAPSASGAAPDPDLSAEHLPDEVLIQWRPDASEAARAAARGRSGAVRQDAVPGQHGGQLERAKVPNGDVRAAIARISQDPSVLFVEPNYIVKHQQQVSDDELERACGGARSRAPRSIRHDIICCCCCCYKYSYQAGPYSRSG
jgi:hypothetical protein